MLISIIIPFYDKDHQHIPNMLNYLNRISFNKEVIFIDDRVDKNENIRNKYNIPNEYKIINSFDNSENVGTFEARRSGALKANGDYIWFVDVDDELLDFNIDNLNDSDIIHFNTYKRNVKSEKITNNFQTDYTMNHGLLHHLGKIIYIKNNILNFYIPTNISHDYLGHMFRYAFLSTTFCVWDNFFKTSKLKEMYKSIEIIKDFKYGEDSFLVRFYLKYLSENYKEIKLQISNTPIYIYNEYITDKYSYVLRYKFHKKETIQRLNEINKRFFENTWIEWFVGFEDSEEEFSKKMGSSRDLRKDYLFNLLD